MSSVLREALTEAIDGHFTRAEIVDKVIAVIEQHTERVQIDGWANQSVLAEQMHVYAKGTGPGGWDTRVLKDGYELALTMLKGSGSWEK